jgi:hypothetical protein
MTSGVSTEWISDLRTICFYKVQLSHVRMFASWPSVQILLIVTIEFLNAFKGPESNADT